jgi:hypothetical protein
MVAAATMANPVTAIGRAPILSFDLMRHDLLMTLKPVTADRITAIVDDLFLPLVAANA